MSFDFEFACEGVEQGTPWDVFRVVRFRGRESLSSLFRYELTLLLPTGSEPPVNLVERSCALRIRTQSTPAYRLVHGVATEVEELATVPEGRTYRLVLEPPWVRARHVKRSRIFLGKTLRDIVESVLQNDWRMQKLTGSLEPVSGSPEYSPAEDSFVWRIQDASRLDDDRVRAYCVQYDESDFAFISRLLEEEGIACHYEFDEEKCVLVFSDFDGGRTRLGPLEIGAGIDGREVKAFGAGARLRTTGVVLGEYNWKQPMLAPAARAGEEGDLVAYVYPGGFPDSAEQGAPLARALVGRNRVEARYAHGRGGLRVLAAGTIFRLEHKKARLEGEYLVTALEIHAEQSGVLSSQQDEGAAEPFVASFECARRGNGGKAEESNYRPARRTARPRIVGAQTAIVTAEPGASQEINVGGPDGIDIGCVRLRFHWDTDADRLAREPSSAWVRVSDVFSGAGHGAVWHPRVGTEVIVEYEEGDPDRPLVVGRVYNGLNLPHRGGAAPISTLKSFSSPGGAVHNEITFDDTAGSELIYTNAGKDMETDVGNNRTETIGSDATMNVGANDTENIGANCTVNVGANDTLSVGANETNAISGNVASAIGANCTTLIGANETRMIGGNQSITIGATHTELVGASVAETYGATRDTQVAAAETESVGANRSTTIAGAHAQKFGALHAKLVGGNRTLKCASLNTDVAALRLQLAGGNISHTISGPQTVNVGAAMVFLAPQSAKQDGGRHDCNGSDTKTANIEISIGAFERSITGASASATGLSVSATGVTDVTTGVKIEAEGSMIYTDAVDIKAHGVKLYGPFLIRF